MKKFAFAILLAGLVPATTAPATAQWNSVSRGDGPMVTGSGRIVAQQRAVADFHRIEIKGASNLTVRIGGAPSLTIKADDNLLPYLTSKVANGTLTLDSRGSYQTRVVPQYEITAPSIDYLRSSGSGSAVLSGLSNRNLNVILQGSGNIKASGRTEKLKVSLRGSGDADLRGLATGLADVTVAGSGNAWVDSDGAVNAKLTGSGNIYVGGHPASLQTERAGSGEIIVARP